MNNANNDGRVIQVLDMTKLFRKEILLYSLFDIHFKTPVRIMFGVYYMLLFVVWSVPIFLIFWPPGVYTFIIAVVLPGFVASAMSKPIWGGKTFFSWFKCQMSYLKGPKIYYDCRSGKKDLGSYKINNEYSVSRSRDYYKLFLLEKEAKRRGKKKVRS